MRCPAAKRQRVCHRSRPHLFSSAFSWATSQPAISIPPRARKFSPSSTICTKEFNSTLFSRNAQRSCRQLLRSRGLPSRWLYLERTAARPCSRRILLMFLALWDISRQQWWNHRLRPFLDHHGHCAGRCGIFLPSALPTITLLDSLRLTVEKGCRQSHTANHRGRNRFFRKEPLKTVRSTPGVKNR